MRYGEKMWDETKKRFDAGAQAWVEYARGPLGRIRQEVTWQNLVAHLPAIGDAEQPPRVLEAGGGSGELALELVRRGYRVWWLDYAPAMLDQTRQAARDLPGEHRARLTLCLMDVEEAGQAFAAHWFDVVTCHTLIEYVPEPRNTLHTLANLLREGGLLSVSFVNRDAEVLRQVWSRGDPAGALARLEEAGFCASLFDIPGLAYTAEQVSHWLAEVGLTVTATRGLRIFSDYVEHTRLDDPDFFDALLRLELAVTTRSPFKLLARYLQLLAHKEVEPS